MATKPAQRFSEIQKNTLFLLYALELKGMTGPVPGARLLKMINDNTQGFTTHRNNYNLSCRKLVMSGHLKKFRNQSLQLAFSLTDAGREKATEIYLHKTEQSTLANNH